MNLLKRVVRWIYPNQTHEMKYACYIFKEKYVVLRLCKLFWHDPKLVRALIGMSESNYRLKRHFHFKNNRPGRIWSSLKQEPPKSVEFEKTFDGEVCTFLGDAQTVFIELEIRKGVFRWSCYFKYESPVTGFKIGVASPSLISACSHMFLGDISGSCAVTFFRISLEDGDEYHTTIVGVKKCPLSLEKEVVVHDWSMVSVEVDTNSRILSFFVGEEKAPFAISKVPVPFFFGMSSHDNRCFTSVSLMRLPAVTPSSVSPRLYECQTVNIEPDI